MAQKQRSLWKWIPSLYFAEGLPNVLVITVSLILFKRMGMSNSDITFYTSWLHLPWVIKPLWSPFIDLVKTKRMWIISMQLLIGAALAGVAFSIPTDHYLQASLAFFWLLAFSSATHDIAADGFYMLALNERDQSFFVGIRSTFYKLSVIFGQGALVFIAGYLEKSAYFARMFGGKHIPYAWSLIFFFSAGLFIALFLYHRYILPKPGSDISRTGPVLKGLFKESVQTFVSFFKKKEIIVILLFLLLYRFAEAQIVKIGAPFMLDARSDGGLGLDTQDIGIIYGTVGSIALTIGGILGGIAISKKGLKFWIWWMVLCLNLPNLAYVYLSQFQPDNLIFINMAIALEQFGYGFGFTAYTMYMIYISTGKNRTTHYAICTGFMALGMMVPGMFAGKIQEMIGYSDFFVWIMICTIPCFVVTAFLKIDPKFGIKTVEK